jgi:diguanylate cyclase (GGDEF)-like protein
MKGKSVEWAELRAIKREFEPINTPNVRPSPSRVLRDRPAGELQSSPHMQILQQVGVSLASVARVAATGRVRQTGGFMAVRSVQGNNGSNAGGLKIATPTDALFRRRSLATVKSAAPSDDDLEDVLTSALLASDKQLGNIVRQVDEISKALKSGETDPEALKVAVHPAVWSAVRHVILERELRYLALTDDLTCLYNRRGFFAAASQQLRLARRNKQPMLLFFCDVNRLKDINDCFGHKEGDNALIKAADAVEATFRESDVLARLGGDEFAVLAFEASPQNQEALVRRLHKQVEHANTGENRYRLSLSVGVAKFDPKKDVALGELMEEADHAMYDNKRSWAKVAAAHN